MNKLDVLYLNAQFQQYCKLNKIDLSQVDSEKRELFMSAWFAGFSDGYIVGQSEKEAVQ